MPLSEAITKGLEYTNNDFNEEEYNTKNVLALSSAEVRKFFLKGESYCNFDFPQYFVFDKMIQSISDELKGKKISDYYTSIPKIGRDGNVKHNNTGDVAYIPDSPRNYDDVNYRLLNNKDGKYAWRPFQLIHPALYVSLVHNITHQDNWNLIRNRFLEFASNSKIQCMSIPVLSNTTQSDKAAMVTNWWREVEQKSIELALDYQYLLTTDITDCYGSIYTHSIAWALHNKEYAKENRKNKHLIGNIIDNHLQDMSFGQTNGIPQGSSLMDFIAEIVLGYADYLLNERICSSAFDFRIIRYRDDYRIFVNNPQNGEILLKTISEVLFELGLKLNPQKTNSSTEVVRDSIKEDKRYWIEHKRTGKSLQKHLLVIHSLSQKYPNSGSFDIALKDFLYRIKKQKKIKENIIVLVSILTDIALKNPRTYTKSLAILSILISFLKTDNEKLNIIRKIKCRFEKIPNTGHLELWLQRITYNLNLKIDYKEKLCDVVNSEDVEIWNSDWLSHSLKEKIDLKAIIDFQKLNKIKAIIDVDEVELFKGYW